MLLLVLFAFLAGVVTILSPCILPILPIVLSSSVVGGKKRPLGVVTGFVLSFAFFTLFLTSIVSRFAISASSLRVFSVVVILLFGLSLVLPGFQKLIEKLFAKLSNLTPKTKNNDGFSGGILVGVSIGLLWTPCVGPILASVISLALTGTVTGTAFLITIAYSLGTALPMLAIVYGGRNLLNKVPWLTKNTVKIQKIFGILMIITAIGIYFNIDRKFQTYILNKFPNYGSGLTSFEDNESVKDLLDNLDKGDKNTNTEKPVRNLINEKGFTAPEIIPGGEWFNLPGNLSIEGLKGKVVLIDFWTYTCINCIRTLPYLTKWYETYQDDNFVIIGVHTPEFEFEKNAENVAKAISDFGIKYPVVQDNNYATWKAYSNRYWPAKYLIDKEGKIRYTHFGEGKYDETERKIQELIAETGIEANVSIENPQYEVQAKTPELYLGYERMANFAEPFSLKTNKENKYLLPETLRVHNFAFGGKWKVEKQKSQAFKDSVLELKFEAKEVFLVMRSKENLLGKVEVSIDGMTVTSENSGEDVSEGVVMVDKDRLYKLIKLDSFGQHTLRLQFQDDNLEVYAFTFG